MSSYCATADCERETEEGRTYCWRCVKRKQRGQDRNAPVKEKLAPWPRVVESAIEMVDKGLSDDDDANDRVERAFKRDVQNWMRSIGWQPPGSATRVRVDRREVHRAARRRTPAPPAVGRPEQLPFPFTIPEVES